MSQILEDDTVLGITMLKIACTGLDGLGNYNNNNNSGDLVEVYSQLLDEVRQKYG